MAGFAVQQYDHKLVLYKSHQGRLHSVGCVYFGIALCCAGILGLLGLLWEAESGTDHTALDPPQLFSPHGNHFGFLWLVAMAVLFGLVPAYAARAYRAGTRIVFDRIAGTVSVNGRCVTRLDRVEGVVLRCTTDPAGVPIHRLVLLHSDGAEWVIHTAYNRPEVSNLAWAIASFLGLERRRWLP
ncbi:MAG: hypothetical protein ACP5VE_03530 [Chthonomonadales bacterium]